MVTTQGAGDTPLMAEDLAERREAVARHPSSRRLPSARQNELVWRQLSMFDDAGYPHGRPHVVRRPNVAGLEHVRELRKQLQPVN